MIFWILVGFGSLVMAKELPSMVKELWVDCVKPNFVK
jgi:hypothetical protein